MRLVGDIESDGFLEVMTTVHCIVLYDLDKQKYLRFNDQTGIKQHKNYAGTLADAVELHNNAKELYYHFGHGFDYPALKKIYPKFNPKVTAMFDTVTMAKAVYRDIKSLDFRKLAKGQYPEWFTKEQLLGTHKLRAWGVRLGELKTSIAGSDGETDWSVWTPEMEDYCEQDVRVTMTLLLLLLNEKNRAIHPFHCHQLDNEFQHCMSRQERQGFNFDSDAGVEMASDIAQKLYTSRAKLQEVFKPFYKRGKRFTPKRNNATQGYTAGVEFTKVELTEFSPASRPHIQSQLQKRYGWVPTEYGKDGNATVDDDTLKTLTYPTIPMIREYQMLSKRQGQVSTGKQAWLKKVNKAGKVHCRIDPMGTVSWRAAHFNFNLAQVPSVQVSKDKIPLWGVEGGYGADSRALFVVPEGMLLCGNDAAGLELRCLANRIAKYDGGAYTELVLNGDVHTANQNAIGLNFRSNAKTWIYAMLYGSGDMLLGFIILEDMHDERRGRFIDKFGSSGKLYENALRKLGMKSRDNLSKGIPALSELITAVKKKAKAKGYLIGLDGRRLEVRSEHSCFNLLLQSDGAIVMKRWLVEMDRDLQANGFIPKQFTHSSAPGNYEYVANVHDEAQTEVNEDMAAAYGEIATRNFPIAGDYYKFKCIIEGDGKVGKSWFETH